MLLAKRRRSSRLLPLLLLLATTIGLAGSHAQHCKMKLRERMSGLCSGVTSFRHRRSNPTILHADPHPAGAAADFASPKPEEHRRLKKRQTVLMQFFASKMPPNPWVRQFNNQPTLPPTSTEPLPPARRRLEQLPRESGSDVGFDISDEEILDLFREFFGRSARQVPDGFFAAAHLCCKDEELCMSKNFISFPPC